MWYLAWRFNTSVDAIRFANSLKSDMIYAGQILIIPAGQPNFHYNSGLPYKVTYGDQLWYLAKVYGTTVDAIIKANNLASDQIFANQVIFIPVGSTKLRAPTPSPVTPLPVAQRTVSSASPATPAAPAATAQPEPAQPAPSRAAQSQPATSPDSPTSAGALTPNASAGAPLPAAPAGAPVPATSAGTPVTAAPADATPAHDSAPSNASAAVPAPAAPSISASEAAMQAARAALKQWTQDVAVTMVAIAGAESGWNPAAAGDRPSQLTGRAQLLAMGYNCPLGSAEGAASIGLWQVFMPVHLGLLQMLGAPVNNPCSTAAWLTDPENNARAAHAIWSEQGFTAWTMFNNGMYRYFLEEASRAVSAVRQLLGI